MTSDVGGSLFHCARPTCWYCGQPERFRLTRRLFGRRLERVYTSLGAFPACSKECATMVRLGHFVPLHKAANRV